MSPHLFVLYYVLLVAEAQSEAEEHKMFYH